MYLVTRLASVSVGARVCYWVGCPSRTCGDVVRARYVVFRKCVTVYVVHFYIVRRCTNVVCGSSRVHAAWSIQCINVCTRYFTVCGHSSVCGRLNCTVSLDGCSRPCSSELMYSIHHVYVRSG